MRRAALILNTKQETVKRKMEFLAQQAKITQKNYLKNSPEINRIQIDDIETFENTKLKPLSITLCVEKESRKIIGFRVSQIAAKGKLAKISVKKYGKRKSTRKLERDKLLGHLKKFVSESALIETDKDPHYPTSIRCYFPKSQHISYLGRRGCVVGQGELKSGGFDPIFSFNHTAAMLRDNMNRLKRRTWATTKTINGLINHLWIYIDFHNNKLTQPLTPTTG